MTDTATAPADNTAVVLLHVGQTCKLLGCGRHTLNHAVEKGWLTPATQHGTGRGLRTFFSLSDVLALKAKLAQGECSLRDLRKHTNGWKRPDLVGRVQGMALVNRNYKNLEKKVDAIVHHLNIQVD